MRLKQKRKRANLIAYSICVSDALLTPYRGFSRLMEFMYKISRIQVYAVAGIHYNIAQNSDIEGVLKPQNVAWEMRQKQQIRENLLAGVQNGLSLVTRKSFIGFDLVSALSNVLSMLEPNIRSVNPSLLSKIEQKALRK